MQLGICLPRLSQADDPLRSATRVDTVASYGQLRPVVGVTTDADSDPLATADTDGMTSIDLDQPGSSAGPRTGSAAGDAADAGPGVSGSSNRCVRRSLPQLACS